MTTVRRTKKALDVEQLEADLEAVDPSSLEAIDATPLRDLFALIRTRELLDNQVTATIATARSSGISWGYIAEALGVSRQAARQKYDPLIGGLTVMDPTEVYEFELDIDGNGMKKYAISKAVVANAAESAREFVARSYQEMGVLKGKSLDDSVREYKPGRGSIRRKSVRK